MARYIDADAFIEDIKTEVMNLFFDGMKGTPRPRKELYDIIDRIEEQPTAEVAPKSEVAREIIEAVRNYMENVGFSSFAGRWEFNDFLAALKKKYTEDQKDG